MIKIVSSLFRYHLRLVAAIVLGVVIALFMPGHWPGIERGLVGWNVILWSYLALLWQMMLSHREAIHVRKMAGREDESAGTVLLTVTLATLVSLAAIVLELATAKGAAGEAQKTLHIVLSLVTLLGGWTLLPTLFTIYYARMYFAEDAAAPALRFADDKLDPTYWDFAYFSFTIAVASQTSDVAVATPRMRRVTLGQSVLSYFFNLAIMGLSINIAASLLS
ncbi:DUF1345 domain-containing protein [Robbsia sp. Bb-Pol-6]|uniref:DUF1345 domain-containing protein n=1 Tax=Robbsia betulipollinis TaxID=2981849 RepID=A0ABT3ZH72_9BURK|nr:DUF1345 domain-containing protein [Robbsia betulipollinis]MCY0385680.1 DUF1345 domain-containing protein [Robbsia betulipollinis]